MRPPRISRGTAGLLTGILLVLGLTLGFLLLRSQATTQVLVASRDLPAGQLLTASDFAIAQVKLEQPASGYLNQVSSDQQLHHSLRRGQLLHVSDLGSSLDAQSLVLAIAPTQAPASNVRVGSLVSIWFVPKPMSGLTSSQPILAGSIASGLQVLAIERNKDSLGETMVKLELQVTHDVLPNILAVQSQDGNLSVIADS